MEVFVRANPQVNLSDQHLSCWFERMEDSIENESVLIKDWHDARSNRKWVLSFWNGRKNRDSREEMPRIQWLWFSSDSTEHLPREAALCRRECSGGKWFQTVPFEDGKIPRSWCVIDGRIGSLTEPLRKNACSSSDAETWAPAYLAATVDQKSIRHSL